MTFKPGFTNVSVQKFASDGDLALFEWNWSEHRELVLGKLGAKRLVWLHSTSSLEPIRKPNPYVHFRIWETRSCESLPSRLE